MCEQRSKRDIAREIGHYPRKKNFMTKSERRQLRKKAALRVLKAEVCAQAEIGGCRCAADPRCRSYLSLCLGFIFGFGV
jgi:hypothetical protein